MMGRRLPSLMAPSNSSWGGASDVNYKINPKISDNPINSLILKPSSVTGVECGPYILRVPPRIYGFRAKLFGAQGMSNSDRIGGLGNVISGDFSVQPNDFLLLILGTSRQFTKSVDDNGIAFGGPGILYAKNGAATSYGCGGGFSSISRISPALVSKFNLFSISNILTYYRTYQENVKTILNDSDVILLAGGGGAATTGYSGSNAGYPNAPENTFQQAGVTGGSSNSGGVSIPWNPADSNSAILTNATKFLGAGGYTNTAATTNSGAGGGGYYGGGAGNFVNGSQFAGAGGSSYADTTGQIFNLKTVANGLNQAGVDVDQSDPEKFIVPNAGEFTNISSKIILRWDYK